ncbi:ankyrin repeat domain-containing protein 50-like [Strongylocentrotus purpuratus]|uniref:ZU5 domain-containing protein n=1 Tax=Strongylocentrotus purpuratus TaxID=7668 RepID=A0A7M7P0B5_STRPU|nr:ankyrin repeat domain-containing protein 50-like [Strongylocentrotus purpuratus]
MALFSAAAKGDVQKIQSLIDSEDKSEDSGGVDVNCTDIFGRTPLHIASENGHLQTVKCLTHHGAKVNVIDANLQTSVHLCSKKGHLHVIELLVNEGAYIEIDDKDGFTALHIASFEVVEYILYKGAGIGIGDKALHIASLEGHLDIVKYLVSKGAELERLDNDYWTPLHLALDGGHLDIAEYLLTKGANINTCSKGGYTALHTASKAGNIDRVKYLSSQGAQLDRSADDGWTALSLASFWGHLDIVKVLVNGGVEIDNEPRNGMTPLFLAAKRGHLGIVEVLLNVGANIDNCNRDGLTALHIASSNGHVEIVHHLVSKGAQLDKCDKTGRTPISCASQEGHLEVIEYIVNKGAGIEISDKDGFTALHIASFNGHLDIVKYLVMKGAQLDKCDKKGRTPLSCASQKGHLEVVEYIVNKGAGIEIGDKDGVTALYKASFNGHLDIVKYLVSKGADPGKLANEEDHYDYLRSTFGGEALPSFMPHSYSPPYDPYLTSPRDSSSSSRKSITEETKIISLDEYSIKVPISPDDVDKATYITAEALTTIPPDLKLEKDEVIISVGLKLSPPGLQFKTPVEVTVSHSAIFTNPDKAEIVLYTQRTESDEFSRIVLASDKADRCVVAKNHLTLYLDHFSEWWIISLIRRYFIGKRLICTPYVPLSTARDVMNYILLIIKDDFCGMKEDTIQDYKVAFPGEQYCVYWGQGTLFVRHLENEDEVSTQELEECAFFHMTTHRMPFTLQPREASEVPVKFILKQKITKRIAFKVLYNGNIKGMNSFGGRGGLKTSTGTKKLILVQF